MTVNSQNIEAVSLRKKPMDCTPRSFAESVLSCPKCGEALEPMLLGMNDNGTQTVWWTCSEVKTKKCTFPLDMPQDVFWITRSAQDIEKNEVPPPNLSNLPIRYQSLYPSLFQYTRKTAHGSRQGSHESTRSVSSMESAGSSNSVWDMDDNAKSRTASKLDAMRRPKVIMTQKKTSVPAISVGNRALAFAESYRKEDSASSSITTTLKFGRGQKKSTAEAREAAKKKVILMLSGMQAAEFKQIPRSHVQEMKKAVIEHVKRRRAEREQLAELKEINEKRNKVIDINDLVKAKLLKNKREYEQLRIAKAREARMEEARRRGQHALPSMPGYDEEEEGEEQQQAGVTDAASAPYAATPPYLSGASSPGSSNAFHQYDGQLHNEIEYMNGEYSEMASSSGLDGSSEMDHSGEVPYPSFTEDNDAFSPFADLGPLAADDLDGIESNPHFEHAFADAFDAFGEEFADISQYY
ncbi:hypothetical protein PMAYCL1PPCAC_24560 [Pristionchus mayeri]|uniref:Uncharacterized protein n=1 Tax=Pristionchus mayeri TaxID=1317129 RepID=A0AAN5D1I3_9BILA|nr:hypothetical protein PMAYCL1PPCAC_24560 [Pristionchus mayeri]